MFKVFSLILLLTASAFAEEVRTYVVVAASIPDTTILTAKGIKKNPKQPLFDIKLIPIEGSSKCLQLEITPDSTKADIAFLDSLKQAGSLILTDITQLNSIIDPRGGDLKIERSLTHIQDIPSFCFSVDVATK